MDVKSVVLGAIWTYCLSAWSSAFWLPASCAAVATAINKFARSARDAYLAAFWNDVSEAP